MHPTGLTGILIHQVDDQAKKNILGENALRLFGLDRPEGK